ncbi:hypothetical protein ACSNOI_01070 [Actinomadura kijaniata]|uniref:hypothetical protein n=1 Tax=Actinomadura kijaniata TaxID=46161 RepID=UPI003F1D89A9
MPAHVVPAVRAGLAAAALLAALAGPLSGTADARCIELRGAPARVFDRSELCRSLRSGLTTGQPDMDRALRRSAREAPRRTAAEARRAARPAGAPARERARLRERPPRSQPVRREPARREAPPGRIGSPGIRRPTPAAPERVPAPATSPATSPAVGAAPVTTRAADGGPPQNVLVAVVSGALLLAAFVARRRAAGPLVVPVSGTVRRPSRRLRPEAPAPAASAVATAVRLARPAGMGLVGPGADGFARAVLVDLLAGDGPGRANVVTTRAELDRLFDGGVDEALAQALAPRLRVCDLLEESIEHLELEMLMAEAERAHPDLSPTGGRGLPTTFWICTPGQDDDVVLPLVRRGPEHGLVGLLFGPWPHGRACAVDADGTVPEAGVRVAAPTPAEALARLRAHVAQEQGGWV